MSKLKSQKIEYDHDDLVVILCLVSLIGAMVYYLYSLNFLSILFTLLVSALFFIVYKHYTKSISVEKPANYSDHKKTSLYIYCLVFTYLLVFIFEISVLLNSKTSNAIISPWQVVPKYFFIAYFLACLLLSLIFINRHKRDNSAVMNFIFFLLSVSHYFISFSAALLVYTIGYGYDPFVHQATVDLIAKNGSVYPKPLYYLGQYSLFVILGKLFRLNLGLLDKFFIPVMGSFFLPLYIIKESKKWLAEKISFFWLSLLLLVIPYGIFIITTPQNFAYLIILILIFKSLSIKHKSDLIFLYLLALTAMAIQPIGGMPALIFVLLLHAFHFHPKKRVIGSLIFLAIISLPLAFFITSPEKNFNFTFSGLSSLTDWLKFSIPDKEGVILNSLYLYGSNLGIIIFAIIAAGILISLKKNLYRLSPFLIMSLSMLTGYFFVLLLPFDYLIDYERGNFSERLLILSIIFSLPFIIVSIAWLMEKIVNQNFFIKHVWIIALCLLITASLYFSYPRVDNYFNSRGYSTGRYDIEAVNWINSDASGEYIVLANQQVSAAALKEFGFKKYFKRKSCLEKNPTAAECQNKYLQDIFYYPVPTGGPLYQYYLKMVYEKPSKNTIKEAMELVGVKEGYFVLNKYWWAFPKILDEAKLEADSWKVFGNNEVYIFKYREEE